MHFFIKKQKKSAMVKKCENHFLTFFWQVSIFSRPFLFYYKNAKNKIRKYTTTSIRKNKIWSVGMVDEGTPRQTQPRSPFLYWRIHACTLAFFFFSLFYTFRSLFSLLLHLFRYKIFYLFFFVWLGKNNRKYFSQ